MKLKRDRMKLERIEDAIWCDVHGEVHVETRDPYGYRDDQPECGPEDWRKVWMGGYIK